MYICILILHMYIHIYIYIYMFVYTYTYVYIYIYIYTHYHYYCHFDYYYYTMIILIHINISNHVTIMINYYYHGSLASQDLPLHYTSSRMHPRTCAAQMWSRLDPTYSLYYLLVMLLFVVPSSCFYIYWFNY